VSGIKEQLIDFSRIWSLEQFKRSKILGS